MFRTSWAVALIALWASPAVAQLTYQHHFIWDGAHPNVRGISGFEVTENGHEYVAVSDFGYILRGEILRSDEAITAMPVTDTARILARSGRSVEGPEGDAEAIAVLRDGSIVIAFERIHRVARFTGLRAAAVNIGTTDTIAGLVGNKGIEALAVDSAGTLFAIPEAPINGKHGIYASNGSEWALVSEYPLKGSYLVVGADFGPDGDLWILERKFFPPFFGSRIRRVDIASGTAKIVWESGLGQFDNLEAIAVWQTPGGDTRVSLVADNNDQWFQRTEVVEFSLQD